MIEVHLRIVGGKKGFHLFQRVVGFRRDNEYMLWGRKLEKFPSLSESSGFPTKRY